MGTRYYAQFLLYDATPGPADEYSGVVEVADQRSGEVLDADEITRLLARSFRRSEQEVELLHCSRLH